MLFNTANSFADGFTYGGINYTITDEINKTVDVGSFNTTTLSKLTIPKTVKNNDIEYTVTGIATMAFFNCSSLTSIIIPESVTGIATMAFLNCSSLTSINIPESVTSIGNLAFCNCSKLTSINIPEGVTSIENACFGQCSSLTSINIPKSVTSIGETAFANCTSLTSIEIPESVTSIGSLAFESCSSLKSIYVNWDTPIDVDYLGVNTTLYVPNGKSENYKNHITWGGFNSILEKSFSYNGIYYNITSSKTVEVSDNIGYKELTEVTIPEKVEYKGVEYSVTSIGDETFTFCIKLTSIDIPESVTSIGEAAFFDCSSLTSIDIPESVTSIGEAAFFDCSSLTSIKLNWEGDDILAFSYDWGLNFNNVTLYIPDGKVESYKEKDWFCDNCSEMYKVTLSVNDEKYGKIKGDVNVISGETETYTAIPNTGYHFVKWEGVSNTENPLEIKVDNNFELKAIFAIDQHTIALSGDNGTFSGAGEYEYGKTVKIEAKPNTGYHFIKWSDNNTDNPREITVTKDYNLTATFEQHISEPINKPVTCTEDGLKDGSKCSVCGVILKEPETIKALGHTYGDPTFIWTDYSKAVAKFECIRHDDTQNIDGVITSDTTLAPTFEKEGELTYTATFTFNGKPYTDTKKQVLEKLKNNGNNGNGTPVSTVDQQTIKVWGYSETIYLDNTTPDSQIQIFDLTGHLIKSLKTTNSHNEIQLNKKGVFVVVIDNKTSYKVAL